MELQIQYLFVTDNILTEFRYDVGLIIQGLKADIFTNMIYRR